MLQMHSSLRLDQIEIGLRSAAGRHGASVLSVTRMGQAGAEMPLPADAEALVFSVCVSEIYEKLFSLDARFAAFLPARIAACAQAGGVTLEAISPREFCRLLHRPELEPTAATLEDALRAIMEEASKHVAHPATAAASPASTFCRSTEDQVNMRLALPQRIDSHGTKVEELAGTGVHDSQGG